MSKKLQEAFKKIHADPALIEKTNNYIIQGKKPVVSFFQCKYALFILGVLFAISFVAINSINDKNKTIICHADYPFYNSVDELGNRSSDIIKGKVLKSEVEKLDLRLNNNSTNPKLDPSYGSEPSTEEESMFVCTVYEVKVTDVIKGDLKKNDIIKVKEMGGLFEGNNYVYDGVKYMEPKKDYILFLEGYNNPDIPYSTLNPSQGFMEVLDGKIKIDENNHLFKNDMDEEAAIKLINE